MNTLTVDTTPAAVARPLSLADPSPDRDRGHTPESWEALLASPAVVLADEIYRGFEELAAKLKTWVAAHGDQKDPGLSAIEAAGVPVPPEIAEWGTHMRGLSWEFRGLWWALHTAADLVRDLIPYRRDAA